MIDDHVGAGGLPQGLALVAFLPARLFAGGLAQARHPRRLLQPVARRRLAAVGTVQTEPTLQFRNAGHKRSDLRRLRLNQRNQLFTDGASTGSATIRFLNRKAIPASRKIRSKIKAAEKNLGSYEQSEKRVLKLLAFQIKRKTPQVLLCRKRFR